jgi:DNA-binding NarL/FixJ family response regulator
VLLVEDHPGVSYAVEHVFAHESDIELVASEASAHEAITRGQQIDVVIVDYEQAGQDGLALARILTGLPEAPSVLIYTAYADVWMTVATVVAGADGLLSKATFGDDLGHAVRVLANGGRYLPPVDRPALVGVVASLPPTEQSITNMLLTGVDPATILRVLSISEAELAAKRSAIVKALSSPAAQGPVGSGRIGPATPRRVEVG